jgi:hypothetical protein
MRGRRREQGFSIIQGSRGQHHAIMILSTRRLSVILQRPSCLLRPHLPQVYEAVQERLLLQLDQGEGLAQAQEP